MWAGQDREGLAQLLTHAVGTRHTAPAPAQLQVRVFCGWPSRGLRRPPTSTLCASFQGGVRKSLHILAIDHMKGADGIPREGRLTVGPAHQTSRGHFPRRPCVCCGGDRPGSWAPRL